MKLVLLLVALVAFSATANGQQNCIVNAYTQFSSCWQNAAQNQDPDAVCNCLDTWVNALNSCSDWCLYAGDYYDAWVPTYCGANSNQFPVCYKALCNLFDNCDGGNVPSNSFRYYWDVIICYYWDQVVCGLAELYLSLVSYAPSVQPLFQDACDHYTDYCNDLGFTKRGSVQVKSTKVRMEEYESQEALNSKRNELFSDIEEGFTFGDGEIGGITKAAEADCNNCLNQCKDCSLHGNRWATVKEGKCEEFNDCPEDDFDDVNIKITSYLRFYNDISGSETQNFGIEQKWKFSGEAFGLDTPSIDCTVTYGGSYNFYSDAVTCSTRVYLNDANTCDNSCDDNIFLDDDLKDMMCSNFPVAETIDDTEFSNNCKSLTYQQNSYTRNNSAGLLVPSVALIAAVVALLY